MEPLMDVLEEIAKEHNKTIAQVSINWLMAQTRVNIVPIPGMRTIRQVIDNSSAMDWTLTEDEIIQINKIEERTRKKV